MSDFDPIDLVSTETNDVGAIPNNQLAPVMRKSMENKNLLANKGSLYIGTGQNNVVVSEGNQYSVAQTTALEACDSSAFLMANPQSSLGVEWASLKSNTIMIVNTANKPGTFSFDGKSNAVLMANGGNLSWVDYPISAFNSIFGDTTSFALGNGALAGVNSVSLGSQASADLSSSVAIGAYAQTPWHQGTAVGYNSNTGPSAVAIGVDSLSRGSASVAVGACSTTTSYAAIALGGNTSASSDAAIAVGYNAVANFFNAIALGRDSQAIRMDAIVLGYNSIASGAEAIAIGSSSLSNNSYSIGIGSNVSSVYFGTIALGYGAVAAQYTAIALGHLAQATSTSSIALGCGANALGANSIAIGTNAYTNYARSIAIGLNAYCGNVEECNIGNPYGATSSHGTSPSYTVHAESFVTTSDERDKKIVGGISSPLEFINQVEVITYKRNLRGYYGIETAEGLDDIVKYGKTAYDKEEHAKATRAGSRQRVGVKAQQVQKLLKELYGTDDYANIVNDDFYNKDTENIPDYIENQYSVNYSSFIPFLIGAIQELSAKTNGETSSTSNQIEELEALKSTIQAQNEKIETLTAMVDRLMPLVGVDTE